MKNKKLLKIAGAIIKAPFKLIALAFKNPVATIIIAVGAWFSGADRFFLQSVKRSSPYDPQKNLVSKAQGQSDCGKQKQNGEWALALPDIRIHLKTIIMKSGALVRIRKTWKWKGEASGIFEFTCLIHGEDLKSVRKRFSEYGWESVLIYGETVVSFFPYVNQFWSKWVQSSIWISKW